MRSIGIFHKIADFTTAAVSRRNKEHDQFLSFYRELVETIPTEAIKAFGNMGGVQVFSGGKRQDFGIELTAADFLWWKQHIDVMGTRFVKSPSAVQADILDRMVRKADVGGLAPKQRKELIALMDDEG